MRAKEKGTGIVLAGLRQYREYALMTQGELAAAAGISRATISDAEQGERISIRNARKIAAALGLAPETFLKKLAEVQEQEGALQHA